MAADQGDLPQPVDTSNHQRPRLLFHNSDIGHRIVGLLRERGLIADSHDLTPRIDMATHYSGGTLLTFWYPQRGEVDGGRESKTAGPTQQVTDEMKRVMLEDVARMAAPDWTKGACIRAIEKAKTYLPGERLRAVAPLPSLVGPSPLQMIFPEEPADFVKFYAANKNGLTQKVRTELGRMEINFLDPTLNRDILAQDIVRTYVEHNLLAIGQYPGEKRGQLESNLEVLEAVSYDDPVYERYREMLISDIQKRLANLSDSPQAA